jgi:hypothetical protein
MDLNRSEKQKSGEKQEARTVLPTKCNKAAKENATIALWWLGKIRQIL